MHLQYMNIICDPLDPKTLITNCYDPYLKKDIPVNLNLGLIDGEPRLKRVVQVDNGKILIMNIQI